MNLLFDLLIKYHSSLVSRDFIIDYFVDSEYMTKEEALQHKMIHPGKLFTQDEKLFVVTEAISKNEIGSAQEIEFPENKLSFYHRFNLKKDMIENYNEYTPIETTLGVYLLNYIVLVKPFGSIIKYINGKWNLGDIEKQVIKLALIGTIGADMVYKYVDYVYFLSSLNDFCVPSITEKSITANPEVDKRREELFEKYKDVLHDPNVMVAIEDELISLDKKLLKDDESSGFMISGKNFDVQRKRMFIMFGLSETFGDDIKGYDFGKFNLNDGWDMKELDVIANDIRRGSYNRAKSTALGGYESKVLGRNFQDSSIIEDDCGTTRGLVVTLTKDNIKLFYYRNIILNKKLIELNEDNAEQFIGSEVTIRSPMYCNTQNGYCYTCMDSRFKALDIKLLSVTTVSIGSVFVLNSLKAMHGSKTSMFDIDDLNKITV